MSRLFFALGLAFFLNFFATVYSDSCLASSCKCRDGRDGRDGKPGRDGRDAAECKAPPPPPSGAIKFGDTADECTPSIAGTVRYSTSQNALELCNGNMWSPLVTNSLGQTADKPGLHCLDILEKGQSLGDGLYWIDPNGGSTDDSFRAYCDMETEGGGWTLFATKVTPGFSLISTTYSAAAAKSTHADAASHIHPSMSDWEHVMFRFSDSNNIRLVYERAAGSPGSAKAEFEKFLMGTPTGLVRDLAGFYRYSPADGNSRHPTTGFATIAGLHFFNNQCISESHGGTDRWVDMWTGGDGSDSYVFTDSTAARGTKCIAGYCYEKTPIWMMVR